jgi:uncharacterized pyridoxal phosphate-containing UPF0001 family protein
MMLMFRLLLRSAWLVLTSIAGVLAPAQAADLPIFDAHIHYSHDAWQVVPPREAVAFVARCRDGFALPVVGLMCIPPADEPPGPHFALLQKLAGEAGLPLLSMGMSSDFETAVEFGATHVRVGSALFGARPYPA